MQAIQIDRYSSEISPIQRTLPTPTINANEVLIKVVTAAVNPVDLLNMDGSVKLIQPLSLPATLGNECSGIISKVGKAVTGFKPGDRVFTRLPNEKIGAFAQEVAVSQEAVAKIPDFYDFDTAAAIPLTGVTAYQALIEELAVSPGKTLLIPGGSGGFGQMAVPLAKELGLKVLVTGNAKAKQHILELGADQYFDYRKENYWDKVSNVDYVIDTLGANEIPRELSVMAKGGRLVSLKAMPNYAFARKNHFVWYKRLLFGIAGYRLDHLAAKQGKEYRFLYMRPDGQQLTKVAAIMAKRKVMPALDPHYFDLEHAKAALKLVKNGHPNGKVLIHIAQA